MKINELKKNEIAQVVQLHLKSLPNTISSKIGSLYLEKIYSSLLINKNSFVLTAIEDNKIIGAVAASSDLEGFESQVKKSFGFKTYLAVAKSVLLTKANPWEIISRMQFEKLLVENYQKPYITIVILFTDENQRRKGIATRLLSEAVKKLPKNIKNLYVDTLLDNTSAIKFYKRFGFREEKTIKDSLLLYLKIGD